MNADTPIVLYVVGAGSSGSTVLGMTLGAHTNIVNAGELSHLDRYTAFDMPCSCGKRLSRCHFWSSLQIGEDEYAPLMATNSLRNLFLYRGDCLRRDPHFIDVIRRNIKLYQTIAKHSGKSIIVDSSKDLVRLYYLFRSGHVRLLPIFLVRDGRSYINSIGKRIRFGAVRSMLRWVNINLRTEFLLQRMMGGRRLKNPDYMRISRNNMLRISYEEFTSEPEKILKQICECLDVPFEPDMLDYHKVSSHNISGSKTSSEPGPITPDMSWKKNSSLFRSLVFYALGGRYWNKRFGVKTD